VLFAQTLLAQSYRYKVNLTELKNDRLFIELNCPPIENNKVEFCFPTIIPGYYSKINYGDYISNLKAFDTSGNELKVQKTSKNTFEITNNSDLAKITYFVKDTWNHKKGKEIHAAAGTNFKENKNFIINSGGILGFFQGYKTLPIELIFTKPKKFYGVTSLSNQVIDGDNQKFFANNYYHLIDCPILFSEPDTLSFVIGNTIFLIGVYSESGKKISDSVYKAILPSINAIKKFTTNKLPVKNYTILIYLADLRAFKKGIYGEKNLRLFQKIKLSKISPGALEHNNSSFYFYPDLGLPESYLYYIKRTITHEILHVYSPLNLKSKLLSSFDFINPKMSQHLWLYEGVTDYLSWQLKLQNNLISLGDFLGNELRGKMFEANRFPVDISLSEWSKKILGHPYCKQFSQVYNKGMISAMLLDFEIMKLTKGDMQLKDIVFLLAEKYGKDNAFDEEDIYEEISNLVHPDLMVFFEKFIVGNEKFDYKSAFHTVGVDFIKKYEGEIPVSILSGGYGVEMAIERVRMYNIVKVQAGSIFKKGDKIRYSDFGEDCRKPFIRKNGNFLGKGDIAELPIIRSGKETSLQIKTETKHGSYYYKLNLIENMSPIQLKCYNKWLEK